MKSNRNTKLYINGRDYIILSGEECYELVNKGNNLHEFELIISDSSSSLPNLVNIEWDKLSFQQQEYLKSKGLELYWYEKYAHEREINKAFEYFKQKENEFKDAISSTENALKLLKDKYKKEIETLKMKVYD